MYFLLGKLHHYNEETLFPSCFFEYSHWFWTQVVGLKANNDKGNYIIELKPEIANSKTSWPILTWEVHSLMAI